jgi:predicted GH43/DUF377 family glycosyl hydrolase
MIPTPLHRDDGTLRIYFSACDAKGAGRPAWVDVDAADPTRLLGSAAEPLLDIGRPGTFDDNGAVVTSVVALDDQTHFLYYVGFELCHHIRYRLLTGLAISEDGGASFRRYRETPILERSPAELYFRCGPQVVRDGSQFRMWYIAGSDWTEVEDKQVPVYVIKHLTSTDGLNWPDEGKTLLVPMDPDEHGFGRPWVVRQPGGGYEMFYSVRRRSLAAYRLGFAISPDGLSWERRDASLGLDVSESGWDSEAVAYSSVIDCADRTYCFYNGNGFGSSGFGCAERMAD